MRAMPTPSTDDGLRFHSNMPISELTECDTQAIKASVVSSAPPVAKTTDGVTHETLPTPIEPHGARGLEEPYPNSGIQLTEVQRPPYEGLEAASRRIEPGEKTQISPNGLCPTRSEADRVISTFLFDPNLELSPQNLHRGEVSGPPESLSRATRAFAGRRVKEQWNAT